MKKLIYLLALPLLLACKKDEGAEIIVRLTDAPGDYKEVNIDLLHVQVKADKGPWQNLVTNQGMYDLLKLTNGIDTTIANGTLPDGRVQQIRLILGDNNNLRLNNDSLVPLKVPSGSESGLKIVLDKQSNGPFNLLLDFDADKSIVKNGNGTYHLKPVIKLK